MSTQGSYIPGVCNIGAAEIRARRLSGWIGLAGTLVLAFVLAVWPASRAWRLLLFFPATLAATGFLQSAFRFCLGFGFKSVFNFGAVGPTEDSGQEEFRRLDRRKARTLLAWSLAAGAATALLAYWA